MGQRKDVNDDLNRSWNAVQRKKGVTEKRHGENDKGGKSADVGMVAAKTAANTPSAANTIPLSNITRKNMGDMCIVAPKGMEKQ